ncbi:MAG: hypothetical protein LUD14_13340 [Clostridiales bacterium]|nr:hypothetical protein [Clostridiales bacterium]
MELYNKEIRCIIKVQESDGSFPKFPQDLKRYLYDRYLYGNWPWGYSYGELYSYILDDAWAYFNGRLDTTVKPPVERTMDEIQDLRELYGNTAAEINDLENYITGSAVTGTNMCFTCTTTGEADDSEDYEVEWPTIFSRQKRALRKFCVKIYAV